MILETTRTVIRGWTPGDIAAYAGIVADPDVMRFIGDGSVHTYAQAEAFVQNLIQVEQNRGWILWAVEAKANHELMGFCGFGMLENRLDFGYRFASAFWGEGLGTEVAQAVLDYGVQAYQLSHCTAMAFAQNVASCRILEKLGFQFDHYSERYGKQVVHYRYCPPEVL